MNKLANIFTWMSQDFLLIINPAMFLLKREVKISINVHQERKETTAILKENLSSTVCIFQCVYTKLVFGRQNASWVLYSDVELSYVITYSFSDQLKNHFNPRKAQRTYPLFLNGHTKHTSALHQLIQQLEMTQFSYFCQVIPLTQYIHQIDAFFKSLKNFLWKYANNE